MLSRNLVTGSKFATSLFGVTENHTSETEKRPIGLLRGDISSVSDIIIPECLRMSTRDSNFLLWDSESDDPGRFLMFGTSENLGLLGYTITGLLTVPLKCLPLYALSFLPFLR